MGRIFSPANLLTIASLKFELENDEPVIAGKFLRRVQTLCVALRMARNSPVHCHNRHSNGVIKYAIAIRLFRTVLRDCLKNFFRYNISTYTTDYRVTGLNFKIFSPSFVIRPISEFVTNEFNYCNNYFMNLGLQYH